MPVQSIEQIAFADIILLNKTDLVDEAHKQRVVSRIKVRGSLARHQSPCCLLQSSEHQSQ